MSYDLSISNLNKKIDMERNEIILIRQNIAEHKSKKASQLEELNYAREALAFIQTVAKKTLQSIELHISNLVSMALSTVDSEFPSFLTEVDIKRDKVELHFYFDIDGNKAAPLSSSAGGSVDVASFTLKVAFLLLEAEYGKGAKPRFTLLLDEPFKNVSPDLQENVSDMLQKLSSKLNLQIIMVSHADDINIRADRTFEVKRVRKKSQVIMLERGNI